MTVVIALKDYSTGVTYIGCDSLRSIGNIVLPLPKEQSKVFESGGFVFGHTGAGRIRNITQALNFRFAKGFPKNDFDLERTLIENLIPIFKDEARKKNFLTEEKGKIPSLSGQVLIAIGTQVCVLHDDFGVTPIANDYYAVGSGQQVALGALEIAVKHAQLSPRLTVLAALKASAKFVSSVGAPFVIKKTKKIQG